MAHTLLGPANKNKESTIFEIDAVIKELRAAMFLVGVDCVSNMTDVGAELWI